MSIYKSLKISHISLIFNAKFITHYVEKKETQKIGDLVKKLS